MEKTSERHQENGHAYEMKWDAIGIGASLACAIHCVLLPVIFTTLTLFDIDILKNVMLEVLTIVVSMSIGGWAIWKGYKRVHGQKSVVVYFGIGLTLMIAANFIHGSAFEMGLKLIGATLLITAHIKNWRGCRNCEVHTSSNHTAASSSSMAA
jgi:hypothetical protein